MRFAEPALASSAAPYAIPILRSVSHSRGKVKSNFCANFAFFSCVSKLAPRTWTPLSSYCLMRSRNPQPSAVHPGVSARG